MRGDGLLPDLAVVDYNYTVSAPQGITVATGMDALTHAVEAYTSRKANAVTDFYCLDAIERIFKMLPVAANPNGSNRSKYFPTGPVSFADSKTDDLNWKVLSFYSPNNFLRLGAFSFVLRIPRIEV